MDSQFGCLYTDFSEARKFFFVAVLMRKVCLALIVAFTIESAVTQCSLCLITEFGYAVALFWYLPFRELFILKAEMCFATIRVVVLLMHTIMSTLDSDSPTIVALSAICLFAHYATFGVFFFVGFAKASSVLTHRKKEKQAKADAEAAERRNARGPIAAQTESKSKPDKDSGVKKTTSVRVRGDGVVVVHVDDGIPQLPQLLAKQAGRHSSQKASKSQIKQPPAIEMSSIQLTETKQAPRARGPVVIHSIPAAAKQKQRRNSTSAPAAAPKAATAPSKKEPNTPKKDADPKRRGSVSSEPKTPKKDGTDPKARNSASGAGKPSVAVSVAVAVPKGPPTPKSAKSTKKSPPTTPKSAKAHSRPSPSPPVTPKAALTPKASTPKGSPPTTPKAIAAGSTATSTATGPMHHTMAATSLISMSASASTATAASASVSASTSHSMMPLVIPPLSSSDPSTGSISLTSPVSSSGLPPRRPPSSLGGGRGRGRGRRASAFGAQIASPTAVVGSPKSPAGSDAHFVVRRPPELSLGSEPQKGDGARSPDSTRPLMVSESSTTPIAVIHDSSPLSGAPGSGGSASGAPSSGRGSGRGGIGGRGRGRGRGGHSRNLSQQLPSGLSPSTRSPRDH